MISLPILYNPITALNVICYLDQLIFLSPNIFCHVIYISSKTSYYSLKTINNVEFTNQLFSNCISNYFEFFSQVWNLRRIGKSYDLSDQLKNEQVVEFIQGYSELIKNKVKFFSKYPFLECNFSFEVNKIEYDNLIEKKFISDLLILYSQYAQKFSQAPIALSSIIKDTLDVILQNLNEQLVTMCKLLYLVIFAFKNCNSHDLNLLNNFDKTYIDTTQKVKEYIIKYTKKRKDTSSPYSFLKYKTFIWKILII